MKLWRKPLVYNVTICIIICLSNEKIVQLAQYVRAYHEDIVNFRFLLKWHSFRLYPVHTQLIRFRYKNQLLCIHIARTCDIKTETQCKNVGIHGYVKKKEKKCNPAPLCDQNIKNGKGKRAHTYKYIYDTNTQQWP